MATTGADLKHETEIEHKDNTTIEHRSNLSDSSNHGADVEKSRTAATYPVNDEDYVVTAKTWTVVIVLACAYGVSCPQAFRRTMVTDKSKLSFWIVPAIAVIATPVATALGDPTGGIWYTSIYTICVAITFMICGANSDLFGRRWFLIMGNVFLFVGYLMGGLAKNNTTMIAAHAFVGIGAGNCQLAAFALPELLPNKWRHIAVSTLDIP